MLVSTEELRQFASGLHGELIRPEDTGFEDARKVWNAMIDRRPAVIVRCRDSDDVARSIAFAKDHGLVLAVRGGGHNVSGNAVCDGGLVIDLSSMKEIQVDPERRTAAVQGGLTLRELDLKTQQFGLATTGGIVSNTGVAGYTLGGGFGYLMRKHGLACDNLLEAEVVTAAGRVLKASVHENPDLFWGIRGGGGNFGVVTSFTFQLHLVEKILFGPVIHPLPRAREVFRFYRKFIEGAPDELQAYAGMLRSPEGVPVVAVIAAYIGPIDEGETALRPLREFGPPLADQIQPTAYPEHRALFDAYYPSGLRNYWKSHIIAELTDEAIDTMVRHFERAPAPLPILALETLGGAVARVGRGETAFDHRDAPCSLIITDAWKDAAEDAIHKSWVREVWEAMRPFSSGGVYVNYLEAEKDEGRDRVKAAYGTKYERLLALKRKYDPENLFRMNQNISP